MGRMYSKDAHHKHNKFDVKKVIESDDNYNKNSSKKLSSNLFDDLLNLSVQANNPCLTIDVLVLLYNLAYKENWSMWVLSIGM